MNTTTIPSHSEDIKRSVILGSRIKSLRLSKGLTQAALADQIHVSKACINRYECGLREPSIEVIGKIADFFGVDFNFLLGAPKESPHREEFDLILIHKFHALDSRGKSSVLNVLEHEYSFVKTK